MIGTPVKGSTAPFSALIASGFEATSGAWSLGSRNCGGGLGRFSAYEDHRTASSSPACLKGWASVVSGDCGLELPLAWLCLGASPSGSSCLLVSGNTESSIGLSALGLCGVGELSAMLMTSSRSQKVRLGWDQKTVVKPTLEVQMGQQC